MVFESPYAPPPLGKPSFDPELDMNISRLLVHIQ